MRLLKKKLEAYQQLLHPPVNFGKLLFWRECVSCVYSRYDVQKGNILNPFVFAWYLNFIYLFISHRHDWDKLKSMLSFQLKQVWGGMPACGSSAIYGCHTHECTQALLIDVHNCILVPRLWYLSLSLSLSSPSLLLFFLDL